MPPPAQIEFETDETSSKWTKPIQKLPKSDEKRPKIDRPKVGQKQARGSSHLPALLWKRSRGGRAVVAAAAAAAAAAADSTTY